MRNWKTLSIAKRPTERATRVANNSPKKCLFGSIRYVIWSKALRAISSAKVNTPISPRCIRIRTNHSIDGLTRMFEVIRTTDNVSNLPSEFRAVIEWGRISLVTSYDPTASYLRSILRLASTVFHHFIAADDASESLAGLKRIHGYMPYFMLKAALKISNPVAMIRSAYF